MVHLDLVHPAERPLPLPRFLAAHTAHMRQMLLAGLIASVTIILVAAAMMATF